MTYLWNVTRQGTVEAYTFSLFYDSMQPGILTYSYMETGPNENTGTNNAQNGGLASVGVQGVDATDAEVAVQYSWDEQVITPGLQVSCDTVQGTCSKT